MWDEAVDDFLSTLNLFLIGLFKKIFTVLYADENILHFDEDFGNVVFNCNELGILNTDLNYINLDDNDFDNDDSGTIIHVRLLACHTKFEKHKALKKELDEDLMPVVWHSNRSPIDGGIAVCQKIRKKK